MCPRTTIEEFVQAALKVAHDSVVAGRGDLAARGIEVLAPELIVAVPDTVEIQVTALDGSGQICDLLEVAICRAEEPLVTLSELQEWFDRYVPTLSE